MKFLANENFPKPSIILLRSKGIEIISIHEEFSGISDFNVIQLAVESKLIILTFDSDYSELIFKYGMNNPPSVVYFRDKGTNPEFAGVLLSSLLDYPKLSLQNTFTVIEENGIRQRFYKQ